MRTASAIRLSGQTDVLIPRRNALVSARDYGKSEFESTVLVGPVIKQRPGARAEAGELCRFWGSFVCHGKVAYLGGSL